MASLVSKITNNRNFQQPECPSELKKNQSKTSEIILQKDDLVQKINQIFSQKQQFLIIIDIFIQKSNEENKILCEQIYFSIDKQRNYSEQHDFENTVLKRSLDSLIFLSPVDKIIKQKLKCDIFYSINYNQISKTLLTLQIIKSSPSLTVKYGVLKHLDLIFSQQNQKTESVAQSDSQKKFTSNLFKNFQLQKNRDRVYSEDINSDQNTQDTIETMKSVDKEDKERKKSQQLSLSRVRAGSLVSAYSWKDDFTLISTPEDIELKILNDSGNAIQLDMIDEEVTLPFNENELNNINNNDSFDKNNKISSNEFEILNDVEEDKIKNKKINQSKLLIFEFQNKIQESLDQQNIYNTDFNALQEIELLQSYFSQNLEFSQNN